MIKNVLPFAALLLIAGCQTSAEVDAQTNADINARLERYNGVSMAEFQSRTGMLPSDAYNVSEGRVFVFRTDPVFITLPATNVTPAVTRTVQCQLLVRAVNANKRETADDWKIVGTERTGACNNLPV